jgi:hypothetical protein
VGWKNSTGGYTVANVQSISKSQPKVDSAIQNTVVVPLMDQSLSLGLGFSFCRPLTVTNGGKNIEESSGYIYAYSNAAPTSIDSATSSFAKHDKYGSFSADFTKADAVTADGANNGTDPNITGGTKGADPIIIGGGTEGSSSILSPSESFSKENIVNLHASMMWVAWVASPLTGIFIARYLKTRLGHNWYRLHMSLMGLGTGLLGLGGGVLIFLYTPKESHLESNHARMGMGVLALMIVQIVLGFVSNHMFDESRTSIPTLDKAHWWVGRILVIGALVTIQFGFMLFQDIGYEFNMIILYVHYGIVGMFLLLFIAAEIKFSGQDSHVKKPIENSPYRYSTTGQRNTKMK